MKIKANEDLFDRWNSLGSRIQSQRGIVQNDMELGDGEFQEWLGLQETLLQDFKKLALETACYVTGVK